MKIISLYLKKELEICYQMKYLNYKVAALFY